MSGETWQKCHSSCLQVSIYTTSLRPLCRVYMYYVYITSAVYITRAGGARLSIPFDLLHWEEHNITFGIFLLGMLDLSLLKKKQWTDLDWGLCRLLNLSRTWIWGQDWGIAPYLKERDWTRMGKKILSRPLGHLAKFEGFCGLDYSVETMTSSWLGDYVEVIQHLFLGKSGMFRMKRQV